MNILGKFLKANHWWIVTIFFVLVTLVIGNSFLFGDSVGYYHHAASSLNAAGFNISTDYIQYAGHGLTENANGTPVSAYPQGNSIIWWPFLAIASMFSLGDLDKYALIFNGHELISGIAIQISAVLFLVGGVFFTYKFLSFYFSKRTSLISAWAIALGSQILVYTLFYTGYSHIYEFGLLAFILYGFTSLSKQLHIQLKQKILILLLIIAQALLISVRVVDGIILIPLLLLLWPKHRLMAVLAIGIVIGGVLFGLNNLSNFGCFTCTGYGASGQGLSLQVFNLIPLLFSDVRGWFIYMPIALAGIIGTVIVLVKNRFSPAENQRHFIYLAAIVSLIAIYTFWPNWWGGDSLGQRFLIVLTPLVAYGLAYIFSLSSTLSKNIRIVVLSILAVFVAYSFSLNVLYRFTPTSKLAEIYSAEKVYPQISNQEYFTPWSTIQYQLDSLKNFQLSNLITGFNSGRSPLMVKLGLVEPILKISREDTGNAKNLQIDFVDITGRYDNGDSAAYIIYKGVEFSPAYFLVKPSNFSTQLISLDTYSNSFGQKPPSHYTKYQFDSNTIIYYPSYIKLVNPKLNSL